MIFDPTHNWTKIFLDERVWNALLNTLFYTGVALLFQLVLGMLIALLLDSDRKGYGILRAMMTLPLVIPPAVTAMMFLLMLNGSFGVLSRGIIDTRVCCRRASPSSATPRPPWPACSWPRSGNGRPSWC